MSDLFDENSSVFEQQLKDIFKPTENKEQTSLFSILALVFYHNSKITDLHDVYKLLGLENFIKLISLLDGRNVRFPTSTELKDAIILALCFYYKEIENKDWQEIKEENDKYYEKIKDPNVMISVTSLKPYIFEDIFQKKLHEVPGKNN